MHWGTSSAPILENQLSMTSFLGMQPCQSGLLEMYMVFIHGDIILTKYDSSFVVSFYSPNSLQMYDPFTATLYDHLKYYFVN